MTPEPEHMLDTSCRKGENAAVRWLGLTLLAACKFSNNLAGGDDTPIDAAVDAAPDTPPDAMQANCFGRGTFYFCLTAPGAPSGAVSLPTTIDTTACTGANRSKEMIGGVESCVIAADTITLTVTRTGVSGNLPLVLAAVTSIRLDGYLDASSFVTSTTSQVGPAADLACNTTGINGSSQTGVGSGGAGGTFGTAGGNGGTSNGTVTPGGMATAAAAKPTTLRGGCRGGSGGAGSGGSVMGGSSGGVVFLASQGTITINNRLDVGGAGGNGGMTAKGGGSGGGSGGLLVIDALSTLTVAGGAFISANGGGGGGGAGQMNSGEAGEYADVSTPFLPAPGGDDTMGGATIGGNGAAATTAATAGMAGPSGGGGGGGGGGGQGFIRVLRGPLPTGMISPAPVN